MTQDLPESPRGRLYVVATPIGNRDDITLRAIAVLRQVDRILAEDTRHSRRLLDHLGIDRPLISLHEHNEAEATRRALVWLLAGESLALVSDAGTPLISDPGFPLVRRCRESGIDVVAVPGANAALAALSVSGLPTDRFCFEGFLPRRQAARVAYLDALRLVGATLVFYESAHRIVEALKDMCAVFGGTRQAVLARELTKLHETVHGAPLTDLVAWIEADPDRRRGEFVVLVAGVSADAGTDQADVDRLLDILLDQLPVSQAADLVARISGERRNTVYRRALARRPE